MKLIADPTITSIDLRPKELCLKDEIQRLWIDKNNMRIIHVRTWQRSIKRAVQTLQVKYECGQIEIYRVAMHYGISYLWGLHGIEQIRLARAYVQENSDDETLLRAFENRFLDFGCTDFVQFNRDFPIEDTSQCEGLADLLDLPKGKIYQLAIMYSLLHVRDIPVKPYNQMAKIFIRFRKSLEKWAADAQKIRQECERCSGKKIKQIGKIPLEEVLWG